LLKAVHPECLKEYPELFIRVDRFTSTSSSILWETFHGNENYKPIQWFFQYKWERIQAWGQKKLAALKAR
jgi:hypothetical protein